MLAVLSPVALDHLPLAAVLLDGEADAQDVVTRLDDAQDAADALPLLLGALAVPQALHQLVLHDGGPAVEEALHHGEEVRVVVSVRGLAVAAPPRQGGGRGGSRVRGGGTRGRDAARCPAEPPAEVPVHFSRFDGSRRGEWRAGGAGGSGR